MKQATTLKQLQLIRAHNRDYLDSINGSLGTALGKKKYTGTSVISDDAAIIVFVPFKIKDKWLPRAQKIKDKLIGPDNLWCHLDVVQSSQAKEILRLEEDQSDISEKLRGWDDHIWMGGQVSIKSKGTAYSMGTIGAFVKRRKSGNLGLLTNKHVANEPGTKLYYPVPWGINLAVTKEAHEFVEDQEWYSGIDEPNTFVRVDCAYAQLTNEISAVDIRNEILSVGKIGPAIDIDLDSISIIGQKVMRIGRTTGLRYGQIVAFGYEFYDDKTVTAYSDLLMIGEDNIPFSTYGDSGSLIVTNDKYRNPIGLLWGGYKSKLRTGRQQENWTYGIGLKRVLDKLDIDLLD